MPALVIGSLLLLGSLIAMGVRAASGSPTRRAILGRVAWAGVLPGLVACGLSGVVHIPADQSGLVVCRFGTEPAAGRVVAREGERGPQAALLGPGWHFGYWPWSRAVERFGLLDVPHGQIGVVTALDGQALPRGRLLAPAWSSVAGMLDAPAFVADGGGYCGVQLTTLPSGRYRIHPRLFKMELRPDTFVVPDGQMGVVHALDGEALPRGVLFAPIWRSAAEMLDANRFLAGAGFRGAQLTVLLPGTYRTSPLFKLELYPAQEVAAGEVGVVKARGVERYTGGEMLNVNGEDLVPQGFCGIWRQPLPPGTYRMNPDACQVIRVKTTARVYSYGGVARGTGKGGTDDSSIMVRSKDRVTLAVELSLSLTVAAENAPSLVALLGDPDRVMKDEQEDEELEILEARLVLPTARAALRNVAETLGALEYVAQRSHVETRTSTLVESELAPFKITYLGASLGAIRLDSTGAGK
ncbi:MAG: hypothetical protein IPL39_05915 [Opitutaceae bacterium]|nr:hypothetical protein [Opitutaceae bacterium]